MLEWTDPPFTAGHCVPEMVSAAGGTSTLGESGHRSEATTWDAVVRSRPDVVVCSPCGYGLAAAVELATQVRHAGHLPQGLSVWAVDADAAFVRPGPRLIDGVEALAGLCHPGVVRRVWTLPYGSDPSGVAQAGRRSAKTNPSRSVISPTTTSRLVWNPGPSTTKAWNSPRSPQGSTRQEAPAAVPRHPSGKRAQRALGRVDAGDDRAQTLRDHVGGEFDGGSGPTAETVA